MANHQHEFRKGDVLFYCKGRIHAQKVCPRGEAPAETKSWCVVGEPERGWMGIESFSGRVKQVTVKGGV